MALVQIFLLYKMFASEQLEFTSAQLELATVFCCCIVNQV